MLLSTGFILSSSSCDSKRNENLDDKLSLERVYYNGNELRIDGYYRRYNYVDKEPEPRGVTPFFLYRNGIIFGYAGVDIDKVSQMEEWFRNGNYVNNTSKYQWGVFQIDGEKIKYEKWTPVQGPLWAATYEGVILNDTTFVINKSYRANDAGKKAPSEHHWEYHFNPDYAIENFRAMSIG